METKRKQNVPQITSRGVSGDYINEITPLFGALDILFVMGREDFFDMVRPLRLYRERYPEDEYACVVTMENSDLVKRLDEIATQLNILIETKSRNLEDYRPLMQEVDKIIYGNVRGTKSMEKWKTNQ